MTLSLTSNLVGEQQHSSLRELGLVCTGRSELPRRLRMGESLATL
jgi:hypothetical protein